MSKIAYSFLENSLLFDSRFLNQSRNIELTELNQVIESYIEFCNQKMELIHVELKDCHHSGIRVFKNEHDIPADQIAINSILQDLLIIPDPVMEFHARGNAMNKVHKEFLGVRKGDEDDIQYIRDICKKLKAFKPFVDHNYLKFSPLNKSQLRKEVPILYSPTAFSEYFESEILNWFHSMAKVYPMSKSDIGLLLHKERKLDPCRYICVEFEGSEGSSMIYTLNDPELVDFDKETGKGTLKMHIPTSAPDQATFNRWIKQSINQTALANFNFVKRDLELARNFNSIIHPRNPFSVKLLRKLFSANDFSSLNRYENAAIQIKLNLPIHTDLNTFMKLREDSDAFHSFRDHVRQSFFSIQEKGSDPDIEKFSKEISAEFSHKYVPEFKVAVKNMVYSQSFKWLGIGSSLGVAINTPEHASALALVTFGFAMKGLQGVHEDLVKLKSMPGYFWTKVSRQ